LIADSNTVSGKFLLPLGISMRKKEHSKLFSKWFMKVSGVMIEGETEKTIFGAKITKKE